MSSLQSDTVYTSKDIIERFCNRAYFDGHVVFHEADRMYKPDIATISRDLKVNEYEIKVSLSDLRKELNYIEFAISDQANNVPATIDLFDFAREGNRDYAAFVEARDEWKQSEPSKMSRDDNKYRKHRHYLFNEKGNWGTKYRPNRFYFLLPKHLYLAEQERLDRIPKYGVIDADSFFSLKKCQPIHNEPTDVYTVWQAALNVTGRLRNVMLSNPTTKGSQ